MDLIWMFLICLKRPTFIFFILLLYPGAKVRSFPRRASHINNGSDNRSKTDLKTKFA